MDELMTFWKRHTRITQEAEQYLVQHGRLETYRPQEHFMRPHQRKPYWCLVLEGLACGYTIDADGRRHIHWFAEPMQGFAGVRHLYTPRKSEHYVQFLTESRILAVPASTMRTAKERFPEVSELLHVLKQQHINRQDAHIQILQQTSAYGRYEEFRKHFPQLTEWTTSGQQADFISIGLRSLQRAKAQYLRGKS